MILVKRFLIILGLCYLVFPAHGVSALVIDDPRSAGLGQTFMASEQGSGAVLLDPAGMAVLEVVEVTSVFNKLYAGLPDVSLWSGNLSAVLPTEFGNFGMGYSYFQSDASLREQVMTAAYAMTLLNKFQIGIAGKYFRHEYLVGNDTLAIDDPVFANGTSKGVWSADMGLRYQLDNSWAFGVVGRNLNQPNWGLVSEDIISMEVQGGVVYTWDPWGTQVYIDALWKAPCESIARDPIKPALGIEKTFGNGTYAIRAGVNPDAATLGLGVGWGPWVFNYAASVAFNLIADNYGTHKVGVSYRLEGEHHPVSDEDLKPKAHAITNEKAVNVKTDAVAQPTAIATPIVQKVSANAVQSVKPVAKSISKTKKKTKKKK